MRAQTEKSLSWSTDPEPLGVSLAPTAGFWCFVWTCQICPQVIAKFIRMFLMFRVNFKQMSLATEDHTGDNVFRIRWWPWGYVVWVCVSHSAHNPRKFLVSCVDYLVCCFLYFNFRRRQIPNVLLSASSPSFPAANSTVWSRFWNLRWLYVSTLDLVRSNDGSQFDQFCVKRFCHSMRCMGLKHPVLWSVKNL